MKREAVGHSKMRRLCIYLNIPLWQAVGLLESLWLLTAREVPAGNIGRLTNEEIAIGLDYRDDPDALMSALERAGWVDPHESHRLIIHDWCDHADDTTHAKVARARLLFADGRPPKLTKLSGEERRACERHYSAFSGTIPAFSGIRTNADGVLKNSSERLPCLALPCLASPEPLTESACEPETEPIRADPTPEPKPKRAPDDGENGFFPDVWADRLYRVHPKRKDRPLVEGVVLRIVNRCRSDGVDPEAFFENIEACLKAWAGTPEWKQQNGRWVPSLARWLEDRGWELWPSAEPAAEARPKSARERAFEEA